MFEVLVLNKYVIFVPAWVFCPGLRTNPGTVPSLGSEIGRPPGPVGTAVAEVIDWTEMLSGWTRFGLDVDSWAMLARVDVVEVECVERVSMLSSPTSSEFLSEVRVEERDPGKSLALLEVVFPADFFLRRPNNFLCFPPARWKFSRE